MSTYAREIALPDGGRLAFDDFVGGEHSTAARCTVVLIHGFALDRRMWTPQVPTLSDHFRLVALDLRGFGGSSPQVSGTGHVNDLVLLLDALGLDAVHLIGLSLGANVALALAMRNPARVRRLVLVSPGLPGHRWRTSRPVDEVVATAREHGAEAARQHWRDHSLFDSLHAHPAARALVDTMIDDYDGGAWRGGPAATAFQDAADGLAAVATPTLVVNGELDLPGYLEIGTRLEVELLRARRVIIARAGHLVNLEQPAAFVTAISAFLSA